MNISFSLFTETDDIGLPSQSSASLLEEGEPIPWTISNRYYDAPVHFIVRSIENVALSDVADVPAIVFLCGPEQVRGCYHFSYLSNGVIF